VVIDQLRLHYATAGAGDPIVLLHGWPQHWWSWRALIAPLAERHRVICPDIRGLGWSEGSTRGYQLRRLAADLIGILDALEIDRTALVGHDWGAAIGYQACLEQPQRFTRFVVLAAVTPWSSDGAPLRLWLRPWHIPALGLAGSRATVTCTIARQALRSWRHTGRFTEQETDVYLAPLRRHAGTNATRRFYSNLMMREIPHYARHSTAMHLRTPTLHINGEHDPLTQGVPHNYRGHSDDMRLELLPDCGHYIPEERPGQLLDRVSGFLEQAS
jgi:pimeloyl-ACP methyl ester carboxylesterase